MLGVVGIVAQIGRNTIAFTLGAADADDDFIAFADLAGVITINDHLGDAFTGGSRAAIVGGFILRGGSRHGGGQRDERGGGQAHPGAPGRTANMRHDGGSSLQIRFDRAMAARQPRRIAPDSKG